MAAKKTTKKAAKRATKKAPAKGKGGSGPQKKRTTPGGKGSPFEPTPDDRQRVEMMVGFGIDLRKIAQLTINPRTGKGISYETLQRHFHQEIQSGKPKLESLLAQSLAKKALSKDHPQAAVCAMFMLKCKFGWRQDEARVDLGQAKSGVLVAPVGMTPEEWVARAQEDNKSTKKPTTKKPKPKSSR